MTVLQRTLVVVLAMAILLSTLELIRRRKLWEKYAILWLLSGVVLLICGVFPKIIYSMSQLLGLAHLTTMLFIAFMFLVSIVLHFTAIITKRTEQLTKLSQQFTIMASRIDELEKNANNSNDAEKEGLSENQIQDTKETVAASNVTIVSVPQSKSSSCLEDTIRPRIIKS